MRVQTGEGRVATSRTTTPSTGFSMKKGRGLHARAACTTPKHAALAISGWSEGGANVQEHEVCRAMPSTTRGAGRCPAPTPS